jgi:hypothetical protein
MAFFFSGIMPSEVYQTKKEGGISVSLFRSCFFELNNINFLAESLSHRLHRIEAW